jgi:hypothetical protein
MNDEELADLLRELVNAVIDIATNVESIAGTLLRAEEAIENE